MRRLVLTLCTITACGLAGPPKPQPSTSAELASAPLSPERQIAARLGLKPRLSFGLGNDAESYDANDVSAYKLGPKVDIHYMYLSGLDWPTWNKPLGHYVTMHVDAAKTRGIVPMFTLYQAAAWGEGDLDAFQSDAFMIRYWANVRILFDRLREGGVAAIVHVEPDLWGYFQKTNGDDPRASTVRVRSLVPECASLPDDASGFGKCLVRLSRRLAPKVVIGLSASTFGAYRDGEPDPMRVGRFLRDVGGADADITVVETLDRDAGCFEAAALPKCQRKGFFYWTEAQFTAHLAWAKTIRVATGKPLLWWQTPLGVPSETPGGTAGHYRDNRVEYIFRYPWKFAQAGGIGAVFGEGARNQTTVRTDGGQFKEALTRYLASGGNRLN